MEGNKTKSRLYSSKRSQLRCYATPSDLIGCNSHLLTHIRQDSFTFVDIRGRFHWA